METLLWIIFVLVVGKALLKAVGLMQIDFRRKTKRVLGRFKKLFLI